MEGLPEGVLLSPERKHIPGPDSHVGGSPETLGQAFLEEWEDEGAQGGWGT